MDSRFRGSDEAFDKQPVMSQTWGMTERTQESLITEAVRLAGLKAIETARATRTKLAIFHNGKVLELDPDELDRFVKANPVPEDRQGD